MVLGEIQFAFICFLFGESLEGFEQWKKLFGLLCACDTAIDTHATFFESFISILTKQLAHAPDDFFIGDDISRGNFLVTCITSLYDICSSSTLTPSFHKQLASCRQLLLTKFKWDVNEAILDQNSEYAPTIVDDPSLVIIDDGEG
jgi:A1 cistron-splicing factor AAR2